MAFAAALSAAAAGLAVTSARAAFDFMPRLNLRRPPLASAPEIVGPALGPRLSRRVVLVMIDGLRLDASYGRPFLDSLRARGVDARAAASFPSFSHPGYVAIVTGVPPRDSGVRNNVYPWAVPLDNLMRRARAAGLEVAYLSPDDGGLPRMFPHDFDAGAIAPWTGGFEQAVRGTLAGNAQLVMLWIVTVDDAGHRFGAATPEYRDAARRVDATLGEVLGQGSPLDLTQDTIVVIADHGHVDRGGHGGLEPEVLDVPFIMAGAGVRPGVTLTGARLIDVAPTIAALLAIPPPADALGHALTEALAVDGPTAAALAAGHAPRHAPHKAVLAKEKVRIATRGQQIARTRAILVALMVLAAAALVWLVARYRWIIVDRRVLLIALPAFPLTFYSMLVVFENWLSPSMMPGQGSIVEKLFSYGGIAAVVHVIAAWLSLAGRPSPHARLAAAAGVTATGLVVALAPVGVAWRYASPVLAQALPEPGMLMIAPVVYAAVACYALCTMLVLLIEYAVFMARVTGR
jgi:hypothetical protein